MNVYHKAATVVRSAQPRLRYIIAMLSGKPLYLERRASGRSNIRRTVVASLAGVPDRGRIIVVNFELSGSGVPPEMRKARRPCVVFQNNKLARGRLVTLIPLSTTEPDRRMPYHHVMDHRSFRDWPMEWDGQGMPRWAKCDYITTISLDRCADPYRKEPHGARRYTKCRAIKADMDAIEKCVLWSLGVNLTSDDVSKENVVMQNKPETES
jgi:uncharacterized protein YifN (PemK superfamily)